MLTAVTGINWGDEGKGRMVDLLGENYDIVIRYQGGNNAGHTVVVNNKKYVLNLLPSGILRPEKVCVMGAGMVIDLEHLYNEVVRLRECGICITPNNLKISDKAVICMPYDKRLDCLEEDRLADKKFGSTRRGIAPVYSDKYMKKAFRMEDLFHMDYTASRMQDIAQYKNLFIVGGYNSEPVDTDEMLTWLNKYGLYFKDYICDTADFLDTAAEQGKNLLFEAQLGTLRDIDFGIYPYTTSSSTIAAYAPIGAGIPYRHITDTIGIMKAYSSCVGEGPFTCELFGEEGDLLREAGSEYGAATGRPRRVGGFDCVASRYGIKMQGAGVIALTKLDILSCFKRIPVCVAYVINGVRTDRFPTGNALNIAKPIYEYLDGWSCDISSCRSFSDLPENAQRYIEFIEKTVNCKIKYVSVGAQREMYFTK